MAYTLWTFLTLPDGTVERYPQKRHQKFFDGELPLGPNSGREAKFVEVALETQKGHPRRMMQAWFTRYELDAEGFLTQDHKDRMMHDAVNVLGGSLAGALDEDVVSLVPRIARRRHQQEHSWHPIRTELELIVASINENAAKKLVATDGAKLLPLSS